MFSRLTLFIIAIILTVLYGIFLAIYRIYFHPLRKFPGPKLVAATKWYEFYKDVLFGGGGTFAFDIEAMHAKYGPIVRISPDEIHVKDPEWFETLYNNPGKIRDKYPPSAHMVGTPLGSFGTISHELHRKRRGANAHFFAKRSVVLQEPTFRKNISLLCTRLRDRVLDGQPIDVRVEYLAYASESVCNTAFSSSIGLLKPEAYEAAVDWRKTMDAVGNITPLVKQFSWIVPTAINLPTGLVKFFHADLARLFWIHKDVHDRAAKALEENEKTPFEADDRESAPSIFQSILSSKLGPGDKSRERMAQEAFIIIVAGSDTISRILTAATFHLLDNPDAMLRLREELMQAIPDPYQEMTVAELEELPWLTGVIKEALRIAALLTSRLPLISPTEPMFYKDWEIPPGTPTSMTLGSILTDPAAFSEPYKFKPERWLKDNPESERAHRFLVPFNRGTRACIGNIFAYAEMYLVLATVFRRFELELYETTRKRDIDYTRDCFLGKPSSESKGVRVKVVRILE